jgi:class 3 adenylate cyclase
LKINYAVQNIINPALKAQYSSKSYEVKQTVGIDTSELRAARTGVRGGNDIVWVGRAANYAAKLTEITSDKRTWITKEVFDKLADEAKFSSNGRKPMWGSFNWNTFDNRTIYGSTWTWTV